MTPEQLKEIEQYAEIRLRTGDVLAAHCLLLAIRLRNAQDRRRDETELLQNTLRISTENMLSIRAERDAALAEIERYRRSLAQQEELVKHFEPRAYSACLQPPEGCQCAGCDYRREWVRS